MTTLCDWLKNLAPFSQPIRSKTWSHAFSRACHRQHLFALSSDWLNGLSASVVIRHSSELLRHSSVNCPMLQNVVLPF